MGKQPHVRWRVKGLPFQSKMLLPTKKYLHRLWRDGSIPSKSAKQRNDSQLQKYLLQTDNDSCTYDETLM